jgi:hypothetical protein
MILMDRLELIKSIVHRRARGREPPSPVDIVGTFDQEQESFNIKELFSWRGYIEIAETGDLTERGQNYESPKKAPATTAQSAAAKIG